MKKTLALVCASFFMVAAGSMTVSAVYQSKNTAKSTLVLAEPKDAESTYIQNVDKPSEQPQTNEKSKPPVLTATITAEGNKANSSTSDDSKPKSSLSRGGTISEGKTKTLDNTSKNTSSKNSSSKNEAPSKSKVEVLDWWNQAKNVFSIGTTAVVQDVYTGKTFKIKRTMGSNHADCEAVSKADTDIIKSIWGGFSWDTRPVIITIGNRRLAASMSSKPHAGIDSAPAFKVVDNRSEGYGTGENLDVIKGNGMDGHFDVHFLNSTRHKDGQVDPRHQAAIKIAGSK